MDGQRPRAGWLITIGYGLVVGSPVVHEQAVHLSQGRGHDMTVSDSRINLLMAVPALSAVPPRRLEEPGPRP